MTIGIYKLVFIGTDKVYIGQSANIENRFTQHTYSFKSNTHSKKLMEAYHLYGMPELEIVIECTEEDLLDTEKDAIQIYDSVDNGFNCRVTTSGGGASVGLDNVNGVYTEAQVYSVMCALIDHPELTQKEISEALGVGLSFVEHTSSGNTGKWLEDKYPKEYTKLMSLKGSRDTKDKRSRALSARAQGITYPVLVDPTGIKHTVDNIRRFGREHNLNNGDLCQVLNGRKRTVKGWYIEIKDNT